MTDTLKEQIVKLQELQAGLERVRQVPPSLLQMRQGGVGVGGVGEQFGAVKKIGDAMMSEQVQMALHQAKESIEKDGTSGVGTEVRRVNRKRQRAASPDGYVQETRKATSVLPRRTEPPVTLDGLESWARAFNETNTAKLRIRGRVVRVAVPDIMTVYMGIGTEDSQVIVETIRAFGPREKATSHGQSTFAVFQQLSQQLARTLEGLGQGALGTVVGHVMSYTDLFVRRCEVCGRVVSAEGHVPCVVRWWDGAGWRAEHSGCVIGDGRG